MKVIIMAPSLDISPDIFSVYPDNLKDLHIRDLGELLLSLANSINKKSRQIVQDLEIDKASPADKISLRPAREVEPELISTFTKVIFELIDRHNSESYHSIIEDAFIRPIYDILLTFSDWNLNKKPRVVSQALEPLLILNPINLDSKSPNLNFIDGSPGPADGKQTITADIPAPSSVAAQAPAEIRRGASLQRTRRGMIHKSHKPYVP